MKIHTPRFLAAITGTSLCLLFAGCQTAPQKMEPIPAASSLAPQLSVSVERFLSFVEIPPMARKSLAMVAQQSQRVIDTDLDNEKELADAFSKMNQAVNCFVFTPNMNPHYAAAILQRVSDLVRNSEEKIAKSQAAGKKMLQQIEQFETLPAEQSCIPFQ